jgi:hypothetical protein
MLHTFVGRTPASAAGPLAGRSDLVRTSTSRAREPGAGQGTHPTRAPQYISEAIEIAFRLLRGG